MFWVRPEALKPFRDLHPSSAIPEEQGLLDGSLGHAIERVFSTSVVAAGCKLANSDASGRLLRSSPGDLWADRLSGFYVQFFNGLIIILALLGHRLNEKRHQVLRAEQSRSGEFDHVL
jgi:hypothetical protein